MTAVRIVASRSRRGPGARLLAVGYSRPPLQAQNPPFDLLIKNGHVIDPRNGVDAVMDVAIAGGKIAQVAANIAPIAPARSPMRRASTSRQGSSTFTRTSSGDTTPSRSTATATAPCNPTATRSAPARRRSSTSAARGGARSRSFKEQVIDRSRTRVLAFLNIVGAGMRGGPVEQNLSDMDARLTAMRAREHKNLVVGVKVAHYSGPEWDPVTRAVQAGREADIPVMVDFGGHTPPLSLEDLLLKHLRPGDILTHTYAHVGGRTPIVDGQGRLRPFVLDARKRGIIFDAGHGGGSFLFSQAVPATKQGFYPDVISTDLHIGSMNSGMKDILNTMSKFLNLGMPLKDVVKANTSRAAEVIKRTDLGHLAVGAEADVAVLRVLQGKFGFIDSGGGKMAGDRKLECELTVKAGQVVWDLNGISRPLWSTMPRPPQ